MTFSSSFVAVAFRNNFLQMHKWCCIIFALSGPFFRKVIDAENTEGNILLADVCAFRHFERVLPAAVQSANCQFDSREKWYVDASAIGTYRRPNLFVALKHLQSALCIVWTVVVIDRLHHARRPFWTQLLPTHIFNSSTISWNFNLWLANTCLGDLSVQNPVYLFDYV